MLGERAIRTAVVQARIKEREDALEKDLRARFPVKVDDAALAKLPMPEPTNTASTSVGMRPPVGGSLRLPDLSKMVGAKPKTAATPSPAAAPSQ
jgi:hypothetical protein